MSVFDSLSKEHALLLRLVERLERAAAEREDRRAAHELRTILLVLFKALEAHQTLEHLVYDESPDLPTPAAYRELAEVERQHKAVADMREEVASLLNTITPEGGAAVRELSLRLGALLRRLIDEEERKLWPRFNAYACRSTLNRLARQAREQFRAMETEVNRYWAEVEAYDSGGR
ncbi:MAG: hemerythrin domain-containing protein [Elusimicrobiota bacterium]|nr:hemerythrin domain-containing protein [Elusimicrobiota bacterium]